MEHDIWQAVLEQALLIAAGLVHDVVGLVVENECEKALASLAFPELVLSWKRLQADVLINNWRLCRKHQTSHLLFSRVSCLYLSNALVTPDDTLMSLLAPRNPRLVNPALPHAPLRRGACAWVEPLDNESASLLRSARAAPRHVPRAAAAFNLDVVSTSHRRGDTLVELVVSNLVANKTHKVLV